MKPVTQALLPLLTRTATGLDYADQRYYIPGAGRFMTADPYQASAGAGDPGSWNRYAYVQGDPVNYVDPEGLYAKPDFYSESVAFGDNFWAVGDLLAIMLQSPTSRAAA